MSRVKHFCFEQRQIHVRRTFGCAAFAGETIAERGVQFRRLQRVVSVSTQLERAPDNIRATARRHNFVTSRDECRTHDRRIFAATATPVALLEIANEGAVLEREGEPRLEWQLDRFNEVVAEVIVDLVGESKNFSGIENVFRIKRALDLAHDIQERVAELFSHVLRARDADSVLG